MSEFDEKLGAILGSPEAMDQIMALAQSLSGPAGEGEGSPGEAGGACSLPEPGRDAALLCALKPYLKPERQKKVEKALELLRVIRLVKGTDPLSQLR